MSTDRSPFGPVKARHERTIRKATGEQRTAPSHAREGSIAGAELFGSIVTASLDSIRWYP